MQIRVTYSFEKAVRKWLKGAQPQLRELKQRALNPGKGQRRRAKRLRAEKRFNVKQARQGKPERKIQQTDWVMMER